MTKGATRGKEGDRAGSVLHVAFELDDEGWKPRSRAGPTRGSSVSPALGRPSSPWARKAPTSAPSTGVPPGRRWTAAWITSSPTSRCPTARTRWWSAWAGPSFGANRDPANRPDVTSTQAWRLRRGLLRRSPVNAVTCLDVWVEAGRAVLRLTVRVSASGPPGDGPPS